MTCQSARDAILDLARGVPIPSPLAEVVRAHLEGCAGCAAELRRQRELTAGLRAIAAEAEAWKVSATLERQLLGHFAALHGQQAPPGRGGRHIAVWSTAAAAVLVLCALLMWSRERRDGRPDTPVTRAASVAAAPTLAAPARDVTSVPVTKGGEARTTPSSPGPGRVGRRPATPRPVEFVVLPDAAALPAFESGTIVRIEVALAELPAYGLKIPPDAARSNVEADVLVGQDGQARAIRLVSESEHLRSRQ